MNHKTSRHSVALDVLGSLPFVNLDIGSLLPVVSVKLQGPIKMAMICVNLPCGAIPNLHSELKSLLIQIPELGIVLVISTLTF